MKLSEAKKLIGKRIEWQTTVGIGPGGMRFFESHSGLLDDARGKFATVDKQRVPLAEMEKVKEVV